MPDRNDPINVLIMGFRQAMLMAIEMIETYFNILPRTSELRREERQKLQDEKDWPGTQGHV